MKIAGRFKGKSSLGGAKRDILLNQTVYYFATDGHKVISMGGLVNRSLAYGSVDCDFV